MQISEDSSSAGRPIRTPDQRLRIFVSSTLVELAGERAAVREAVESLRLAPVMFELGARPYPPRDLYRAYLAQSDVFVGIYWQSYGWVAPDEEISGLEDEYRLATGMPRLLYVKRPAPDREPRLDGLLDRIRRDDHSSYKAFSTVDELRELVQSDLALLLSERFDESRTRDAPSEADSLSAPLPATLSALVGRGRELSALSAMIAEPQTRLVTVTGPGGIGKSRLSIEVAWALADRFPQGVGFVRLSSVQDPKLVAGAIAQALGVRNTGDEPVEEKLVAAVAHCRMLLVLDNFEQVVDAGPLLTRLLAAAPGLVIIVTSRSPLKLTGEHVFDVGPLGLPATGESAAEAIHAAAVALFVARARAVKPDFELTQDNVEAVVRICRALDGVPLALELVAARVRLLSPPMMIDLLHRDLAALAVGSIQDLPERQQTLRATIEWSLALVPDEATNLLATLGVFANGFSLEAIEHVAGANRSEILELLAILVDSSLVQQQDHGSAPRFTVLSTVRDWARQRLDDEGTLEATRERHADFFLALAKRLEFELEGPAQTATVYILTEEYDNITLAMRFLIDRREWMSATLFAWHLYIFWWVGGHLGEVSDWMEEVLREAGDELADHARAIALYFTRAIRFWADPDGETMPGLELSARLFHDQHDRSAEALARISLALALLAATEPDPLGADVQLEHGLALFRAEEDQWGEAFALIALGRVALLNQRLPEALDRFEQSLVVARRQQDHLGEAIALHHLGWALTVTGDQMRAEESFRECLTLSAGLEHVEGVAYGLEGLVAIAALHGDSSRAATLVGAADALRQRTGVFNAPTFSFHNQYVAPLRSGDGAVAFEAKYQIGRTLSWREAVDYALTAERAGVADARA